MTPFRQALQIAIAGVQGPLPPALDAIAREWSDEGTEPADALWRIATFLSQAERLARPFPVRPPAATEPAPEETRPLLAADIEGLLRAAIREPNVFVMRDLAALLTARGEILPPVYLPTWFVHALAQPAEEHTAWLAVTGERGPWLVRQNPDWHVLIGSTPGDAAWDTGSLDERAAWLAARRHGAPADARAALQAAWSQEAPEARERLLRVLADGLCADDESLLETARTDKRKEIRALGRELLGRLPSSAFAQRLLDRLAQWLSFSSSMLGRSTLDVRLPATWEKDWALDGLTEKTSRQHEKIGDRANWLVDTLAQVPLPALLVRLGTSPAQWRAAMAKNEFSGALWTGSVASFERFGDPAVLEALFGKAEPPLRHRLVVAGLAHARRTADLAGYLGPLLAESPEVPAMIASLPPLDERWSRVVYDRLRDVVHANREQPGHWADALPRFAERAHPETLSALLAWLDPLGNEILAGKLVASAAGIAKQRLELHRHHPSQTARTP